MFINGATVGVAYAIPTLLERLSKSSLENQSGSQHFIVQKVAKTVAIIAAELSGNISPPIKFAMWDVVAKNAWISLMALIVLSSMVKKDAEIPLVDKLAAFSSICSSSWLIRMGISRVLEKRSPLLAKFIEPSNAPKNGKSKPSNEEHFPDDVILNRYLCPISQAPIREVAVDPNKVTLYDKRSIMFWLFLNGTSPMTRARINAGDLEQNPGAQAIIDSRIAFLNKSQTKGG